MGIIIVTVSICSITSCIFAFRFATAKLFEALRFHSSYKVKIWNTFVMEERMYSSSTFISLQGNDYVYFFGIFLVIFPSSLIFKTVKVKWKHSWFFFVLRGKFLHHNLNKIVHRQGCLRGGAVRYGQRAMIKTTLLYKCTRIS